jgi:hypothetical protein
MAGPISKLGYEGACKHAVLASEIEASLVEQGYAVHNPYCSVLSKVAWRIPHSQWLMQCLEWVSLCHAICMLPGWRDSVGAVAELSRARSLGLAAYEWIESGLQRLNS